LSLILFSKVFTVHNTYLNTGHKKGELDYAKIISTACTQRDAAPALVLFPTGSAVDFKK
jgi:hypothetical protein